jgi:hypothetical protein
MNFTLCLWRCQAGIFNFTCKFFNPAYDREVETESDGKEREVIAMSDVKQDPRLQKEMVDLLSEYAMARKLPVKDRLDEMNKNSYIDDIVKRMNDVLTSLGKAAFCLVLILAMSAACLASNVPGKKDSFTIGYAYETNSVLTATKTDGVTLKQTGLYIAGETPITENLTLVSNGFFGNSSLSFSGNTNLDYSGLVGSGMIGLKIEW